MTKQGSCEVVVEDLWVKFGPNIALSNVNVVFHQGLNVIMGPNGSGKTTLLRVIAGLIRPHSGRIVVCGGKPTPRVVSGIVGEERIPPWLRVKDYLDHMAVSSGCKGVNDCSWLYGRSIKELGIMDFISLRGTQLSSGMKKRVQIAVALMRSTPVLVMDEPFSSLDPSTAEKVSSLLIEASRERIVIMATHIIPGGLRWDKMIQLVAGSIVGIEHGVPSLLAETIFTETELDKLSNSPIAESIRGVVKWKGNLWVIISPVLFDICVNKGICTGEKRAFPLTNLDTQDDSSSGPK